MKIEPFIDESLVQILPSIESGSGSDKDAFYETVSKKIAQDLSGLDAKTLRDAFLKREAISTTAEPLGVAFPHAVLEDLEEIYVGVMRVKQPLEFGASDNVPTDLFFFIIGGSDKIWQQGRILARLGRFAHSRDFLRKCRKATTPSDLFTLLREEDLRHV